MIGILNSMFRRSTGTDNWNAPKHWYDHEHRSAFERQEMDAKRNRMFLARDRDLLR